MSIQLLKVFIPDQSALALSCRAKWTIIIIIPNVLQTMILRSYALSLTHSDLSAVALKTKSLTLRMHPFDSYIYPSIYAFVHLPTYLHSTSTYFLKISFIIKVLSQRTTINSERASRLSRDSRDIIEESWGGWEELREMRGIDRDWEGPNRVDSIYLDIKTRAI